MNLLQMYSRCIVGREYDIWPPSNMYIILYLGDFLTRSQIVFIIITINIVVITPAVIIIILTV